MCAIGAGLLIVIGGALDGCTFEPTGLAGATDGPDGGGTISDASVSPPDGAQPADATPRDDGPLPERELHLLLTEVKTQPSDQEFVEIFNPLDTPVALDEYYLSDDPQYAVLPGAAGGEVAVGNGDAIMRFPDGATIAAGQAIVVALAEQGFRTAFGRDPDYALVPDVQPSAAAMVPVADGSRTMDINDTGEPIILFRWDGDSDLVADIDIVFVGNEPPAPGSDNRVPDKSAVETDGPDADATASQYAPDASLMTSMSFRASNAGSYQRVAREEDHEARGDGNGIDGHDETSEDTLATWGQADAAPTPGEVAAALRE